MRNDIIHNETMRYDNEHNKIEEMYRNGIIPYNMKVDMQERGHKQAICNIAAIDTIYPY